MLRYREDRHAELPHVAKFSGGRSSGMLLFRLLEGGALRADRGDVIVFNNTSAEHPATYRFVGDCLRAARTHGVPFFLTEFQTYEDARQGEWTRLPTYRMVNERPRSEAEPDGYQHRGEAFEELVSWTGFVPNQFRRTCTRHLKLDVTRAFLRDWFSGRPGIPRRGHYGDASRIDPDAAHRRHRRAKGKVPKDIYVAKRRYVWGRPHVRPEQRYADYWPGWEPRDWGLRRGPPEYVSLIGLRADEPARVERVASWAWMHCDPDREGEHAYTPLADMGVGREDVNRYWSAQSWDLDLPAEAGLSNCTYCFLKGASQLRAVHAHMRGDDAVAGTPSDLAWWKRMEAKYSRDYGAQGEETTIDGLRIGFFGARPFTYDDVDSGRELGAQAEAMLPCDCTE